MFHFFVNPASRSGSGSSIWDEVREELDIRNIEYDLHFTKAGCSIKEEYEKILSSTEERPIKLVVIGGDGTLNQCIEGITDLENTELSLIKNGSGNDFSRNKSLPASPRDMLDGILERKHIINIDVGEAVYTEGSLPDGTPIDDGRHRFLVSSGFGYDADICYNADHHRSLKKVLKSSIYPFFGVVNIFTTPRSDFEVNINGQIKIYPHVYFMAAMNQPCEGGGVPMVPTASDTDGKLGICLVYGISRLRALLTVPAIMKSRHSGCKGVVLLHGPSVTVHTKVPRMVHYDGETPGTYKNFTASIIGNIKFIF